MRPDEIQTTPAIAEAIKNVLDDGSVAVLSTLITRPSEAADELRIGAKLLIRGDGGRIGDLGNPDLNQAVTERAQEFLRSRDEAKSLRVEEFAPELKPLHGASVLFERIEAEPRLVICGAGHVGASLARLAALLGYHVTLVDDRTEFVQRDLFAAVSEQKIHLVTAASWSDSVTEAIGNGRGVSVAIVTRGHKQDEDCLRAVIAARPDYSGMIGSKRRTNIVLEKLRTEGAADEALRNVHAPIGLDIGAVSPEEVALAILAEIVANRRSGTGGSLSAWRRT